MTLGGRTALVPHVGKALAVPEIVSLEDNHRPTCELLSSIRNGLQTGWVPFSRRQRKYFERKQGFPPFIRNYYDFSTIKEMSPAAAMMIASEYDLVRRRNGLASNAVAIEEWAPHIRSLLEQVGFLALVGAARDPSVPKPQTDITMFRIRGGIQGAVQKIEDLFNDLDIDITGQHPALYEGIAEAITNTIHHAYPEHEQYREPHLPMWWTTGSINRRARSVDILVYDHGVSIPVTLATPGNRWELMSSYRRVWSKLTGREPSMDDTSNDGAAIAVAMKIGKSRTGQAGRGRGLPALEDVLNHCQDGRLSIWSRNGLYRVWKGQRREYRSFASGIGGTLVSWRLNL